MGRENKVLTYAVLFSLISWCNYASAKALDTTETITSPKGTYNSIKVTGSGGTYGIKGDGSITVSLEGEQLVEVSDTGKTKDDDKSAMAIGVSGAKVKGTPDGIITIKTTARGGTAIVDEYADAKVTANACGLSAEGGLPNEIVGAVTITAKATGGTATADSFVTAGSYANGLYANDATNMIIGDTVINTTATGGSATAVADNFRYARADNYVYAYGLNAASGGSNIITGAVTINTEAVGGAASAYHYAYADAYAYGLYAQGTNIITGTTVITAKATGGTATAHTEAEANAYAYGLLADGGVNKITGDTVITATAIGGTANDGTKSEANADTKGLYAISGGSNEITGTANITVTATGGTSNAASNADAKSRTFAYGLHSDGGYNEITEAANITVTAIGGTSSAVPNTSTKAEGLYANAGANRIGGDAKITVTNIGSTGDAAAYGLHADGSSAGSNTIDGDAIIMVTAKGGNSAYTTTATAETYGLYAAKGSSNTIKGNVTIIVKAEAKRVGQLFIACSMFALNAGSKNDLSSSGTVKKLEGDIYAISGKNILNLDTTGSYLQGNIITESGANEVTVASGATWRPVYNNRYGTDCLNWQEPDWNLPTNKVDARSTAALTLKNGGIVDLTWDGWNEAHTEYDTAHTNRLENGYRNLTIDNLSGGSNSSEEQPDGIFRLDSDLANAKADKVTLGAGSTATNVKIQINYDTFYGSSTTKDEILTGKAIVVTDESGKLQVSGGESIYNENTFLATVEQDQENKKDWLLTGLKNLTGVVGANINTKTAAASRYTLNNLWLAETNSLHKRVGDLRLEKTTAEGLAHRDGLWAKYGHGTLQNGNGSTAELQYNQFQIGYDKAFTMAGGQVYRGVTLSRMTGDTAYAGGSGEASSTTLGLYQAWLGDTGHYYDVVLKHGKLANDYKVVTSADSGDYSAWGTTLSGEYGYRQALSHGAYFEPQAEVILGHVGGADYTTANGMQVNLDSTNHALTRLGFALGQEFTGGKAFVQANYYHDFAGGGGVTTGVVGYEREQAKNWYELGLGGTVQLSESTNVYAEINKYFGDTKSKLIFNVGMRYSF